jgi:hypothetical protein
MCAVTPDLASMPRGALVLPRILRPWTLPPCRGGLRCYHVFRSHGRRLPVEAGSSDAMCSVALDLIFLLGRVPVRPHVL